MGQYVLQLQDIDRSQIAMVGGKAATLGDLSGIDGIRVPAGFCVTTEAFARLIARAPSLDDQLDQLSHLALSEYDRIRTASATIRQTIEEITIPA